MKFKNLVSTFLAIFMMFSILTTAAFAQPTENGSDLSTDDYTLINGSLVPNSDLELYNEGTIEILPSMALINRNGTFTFDINTLVTSTTFKVNSNQTTFKVSAGIYGPYGDDVTSSYPNHRFEIVFYKKGAIFDSKVDSSHFYADKTQYSWTVTGLNTSDTYYFMVLNTDYLPAGTTVSGSGSLTNYVHP